MHTTRHISRAARGATSGRGPGAAVAGALALLLLGAGGQAGADEGAGTGTSARDTALDFIAGAPRTWYDLSATVGLDAAYDSNVYNGRGPDEVTRVSPRLALALHDRRNELKLSYDLGYWVYALGKADSSVNHRAQASYDVQATRRLRYFFVPPTTSKCWPAGNFNASPRWCCVPSISTSIASVTSTLPSSLPETIAVAFAATSTCCVHWRVVPGCSQ